MPENPPSNVSHPSHYTWHPAIECIEVTQHFNFNVGNAIKNLWRAGLKSSTTHIEDLQKARQYIDFEIKRLEGQRQDASATLAEAQT